MKIKQAKQTILEVDMTPMIDMTFQLIAFFMIVTNFEQTQADERVKLPADKLARPPIVARQQEVVLNVGFDRNLQGEKISPDPVIFYGTEKFGFSTGLIQELIKMGQEAKFTKFALKAMSDDVP